MAIENDISGLLNKTENEGSTEAGRLTAVEWNQLVSAVREVQQKSEGTIKGIKYNEVQTFNEIDENGYLKMTVADTSGYELRVDYITEPPLFIAKGASCPISIDVSSKEFIENNEKKPVSTACVVNTYINNILVDTAYIYDKTFADKDSQWYDPSKTTVYTFDLSTARATSLNVGTVNDIKVEVNNRLGKIQAKVAEVTVIELGLQVTSFSATKVFTETNKPSLNGTVTGNDAGLYAKVDGESIVSNYSTKSGEPFMIDSSYFESVNRHGVHTIEIWAQVVKSLNGVDYVISTEPLKYTYIYGTSNPEPVVMSDISNTTPEEYSTLNISYIAYKYNSTAAAVKDTVSVAICEVAGYDEQGKPIPGNQLGEASSSEITFDPITNSGEGTAGISLFPVTVGDTSVSLVGKKLIRMSIGDFNQYTEIEVLKSSVNLTQLGGYAVYLTSAGRNNNQGDKREWISKDGKDTSGNKLVVNTIFDNNIEFIDTGSGWIKDSDGNVAMHLNKGKYFTVDYQPFTTNPVYNDTTNGGTGKGKTISFELATRNCLKNDSTVVTCMDDSNGDERGFVITASSAILKSNNFGLQAKFRENTRIKIDFVIEGIQNEYKYTTIAGKDATENDWEKDKISKEALCIVYVDGVYQALKVIPNGCTFKQGRTGIPAKTIRFGSEDCDLDIYNVRIYDYALTPAQVVNNYAYDTPKYEDKIAIAQRNDIFDATSIGNKPNINIEKLRKARPELPFWYIKMNMDNGKEITLPYDKTNWKKVWTEFKNPLNEGTTADKNGVAPSFTTDKGQLRNQGTSSMTYPWPWRNWDWKTKGFTWPDGTTTPDRWNQYAGMNDTEALQKITLKKDYASSEMCNNAITSEYFTDMALAIGDTHPNVLSPAQRALGSRTPFRLTFRAIPCFMFQEFQDPNQEGSAGKGFDALGMMNLIANKNECGHLGFMGDYVWDSDDNSKRAQSWELADNMDDWFWYQDIHPIYNSTDDKGQPKIVNEPIECYEARYPKDSTLNEKLWNGEDDEADFGSTPKGYNSISEEQQEAVENEQADIIEFHNWLVSCNRQIPEDYKEEHGSYATLSSDKVNEEWNNGKYTQDTPAYRLAKFIAEAPTRLIIDQFCMYYIWRETFHAFDSGFKNLQVYTMGKANDDVDYMQWGCMVRDADTTLGIENTGKDIFPPHLEDIDYYTADADAEGNAVSNVKFVYSQAGNVYHAKTIDGLGGHPILNGQFGTLWINLRDGFRSRIGEIYRALKGAGAANWNGSAAIKRFRDHQEKWCENLYNFGMRQYFGGAPFTKWIESGLGDKKNSRASWLERGFYYRDTKYLAVNDVCTVRAVTYETPDFVAGNTAEEKLHMKSYIPMYFLTGATTEDPSTCTVNIRVVPDDNNNLDFDVTAGPGGLGLASTGDQNRWFWCSSMLTEIGDLARVCKVKMFQKLDLPKVKDFSLGHEPSRDGKTYKEYYYVKEGEESKRYERVLQNEFLESIAVDSLKSMTVFDITNHKKLNQIEGLEECKQLQEFYARGTDALRAITLPASTSLRKVYLGKSIVTLNLTNLTGIEEFELEGADNMQQLFIRDCGSYMATRSYDIMLQVLPSLEKIFDAESNNNVCQLSGINWQNVRVEDLERLYNINAQLSGTINLVDQLRNDFKVKLINRYGNIDDPNNGLYVTYTQYKINSISMPNKLYIFEPGQTELSFTSNPVTSNTYSYAEWTLQTNNFATIDSATGVITRNSTPANEATPAAKLKVKVYQIPDKNGVARPAVESNEVNVYFYERNAKPGDIVYHDGSFTDENDATKTPIGVCFYVDPDDNKNRLMVALENIYQSQPTAGYKWGIGTGSWYTDSGTGNTVYYGSPQINPRDYGFETDNMNEIIDIPDISNIVDHGGDVTNTQMLDDSVYRNMNASKNNYFTQYPFTSYMGNMGWDTAKNDIEINYVNVVEQGKTYPVSFIYTMAMIARRNYMLDIFPDLKITGTVGKTSEYSNLFADFENAEKVKIGDWTSGASTYLYPAASLAYAYEPGGEGNIEGLLDKFKKNNWFIPTSGECVRISYYMRQYYLHQANADLTSEYEDANAFKLAIDEKILKTTGWLSSENSGTTVLSSTEGGNTANNFVTVITTGYSKQDTTNVYSGICSGVNKYDSARLRPICKF